VGRLPVDPAPRDTLRVMTERRSHVGSYIAFIVLAVLLVAGIGLVVAMITRPGPPDASVLAVTDRSPVPCPDHQRNGTCFETQVTNNGRSRTGVLCQIRSSDGSQATFVTGATSTQIVLDVDQSVHIDSIIENMGVGAAHPPIVSCTPVPN